MQPGEKEPRAVSEYLKTKVCTSFWLQAHSFHHLLKWLNYPRLLPQLDKNSISESSKFILRVSKGSVCVLGSCSMSSLYIPCVKVINSGEAAFCFYAPTIRNTLAISFLQSLFITHKAKQKQTLHKTYQTCTA